MTDATPTPAEIIEAMADALGRHTYRNFGHLAVDLEPKGNVAHDDAVRIAKISRRLTIFERSGFVTPIWDSHARLVGWRLTEAGTGASRADDR